MQEQRERQEHLISENSWKWKGFCWEKIRDVNTSSWLCTTYSEEVKLGGEGQDGPGVQGHLPEEAQKDILGSAWAEQTIPHCKQGLQLGLLVLTCLSESASLKENHSLSPCGHALIM
jgi:hypothetical protein